MMAVSTFDKRELRNVLGTFTTGVTIVTTRTPDGKAHGMTVNSFSSVSLDPPLVLWSQALSSGSYAAFQEAEHFAVNILADDQVALSDRFAQAQADKFAGVQLSDDCAGSPVLAGSAAHLECTKIATYPGGDHVVYIGHVDRIGYSHRRPLAFASGRYMIPYAQDLGPVSIQLGAAKTPSAAGVRTAVAAMPAICEAVGHHTLCLSVWGNHGPTSLYWEPSAHPVSDNLPTGLVMNVTSSAAGRAFAAFLPSDITARFIEEDLRLFRRADEDPRIQRAEFDAEIETSRQHGVSRRIQSETSQRLHKIATAAFGAPIRDAQGQMLMALTMISHVDRLEHDWNGPAVAALKQGCEVITNNLVTNHLCAAVN